MISVVAENIAGDWLERDIERPVSSYPMET
jgi:hypothetical protein